jgi:hypothetical protein
MRDNAMYVPLHCAEPSPNTALAVRGVRQVVNEGDLVAVVADHSWAAMQGMKALAVR